MDIQGTIFGNEAGGYRLQYFQVYNWGTFGENQVWKLEPNGRTSLLTGANGSGKTTLVDALLTLLVPSRLRYYNQSSGAESKRDRTETSYVQGAFGQSQQEGRSGAQTEYLRDKNGTYSVLMGCFYNSGLRHYVTLGQIRWFMTGGKLNQEFFSAHAPLDIAAHDIRYDPGSQWKERLRKLHKVQFHPSFAQFQEYFLRALGMRSEKALNLFNQTVGIKVLGKLDEFIRDNMLEPGEPEEDFRKLQESFETLLSSYRAFEKAKKQLELLEPIARENEGFTARKKTSENLELQKRLLPVWFAQKETEFLISAIAEDQDELQQTEVKIGDNRTALEGERQTESELRAAISQNETGRQIQALERDIAENERRIASGKEAARKYNELAKRTGLRENPDEAEFLLNLQKVRGELDRVDKESREADETRIKTHMELHRLTERKADLEEEFLSLSARKSQIPGSSIRIREALLTHTGANEKEIPFVGELLRVKDTEAAVWENAIERVMHNFALRLLVPEKYYREVNRYVNSHQLKGRIVYHRIDPREAPGIFRHDEPDALYHKVEIRSGTAYAAWLERELHHRFDHFCTADLDLFRQCDKALTPEGLIKNVHHHEKDDRPGRTGRENYVLGWDNRDKLRFIRDRIRELEGEMAKANNEIKARDRLLEQLKTLRDDLLDIRRFDSFTGIHWQPLAKALEGQKKELEKLRKSSNQLRDMQERLERIQARILRMDSTKDKLVAMKARLEDRIRIRENSLGEARQLLESTRHLELEKQFALLSGRIQGFQKDLALSNLERTRREEIAKLDQEQQKAKDAIHDSEKRLLKAIGDFRNPSPEIQDKFRDWSGETREMGSSVEYVQSYLDLFATIKSERLLDYEKRFREYLDTKMIGDMAGFQTALENRLESIEDTIRELNLSLRSIDFRKNPRTYIQLVHRPNTNEQIRDFRQSLRSDWRFDAGEYERTRDTSLLERSFSRIKAIIESLQSNESYRNRVLDVRNWLLFHATEHFKESDEQFNVYESTGHLSGGEKAQITYTILGAALAYQFGIDRGGQESRSFRFIVVDEAFSKLDPEKSKYLMELCDQLHLQLLVVTPLDKIHVAEPYIHAVHYVENKDKRHSRVYNLTFAQYQERKATSHPAEIIEK